jgi:energy-coupling factor transport system ATP-binding protein
VNPIISVRDVTYAYPAAGHHAGTSEREALLNVSLEIHEGESVAVVGANGSGKSTLARHLNALLLPSRGQVRVAGRDTREVIHHPEIRRTVGMVFQRPDDQVVASVVEHDVAFGPENLGWPRERIRAQVRAALEAVGLWEERLRPPHMLSAGQMQRLAVAGVLAMRPSCIVFDEATAMLDPAGRRAVRELMRDLHQQGLTTISITHLMDEALEADRVIVLHRGEVAFDGTPATVFRRSEELRALGLDVPTSARVAAALRARIPGLPEHLITVEDLVAALETLPRSAEPATRRMDSPAELDIASPHPAAGSPLIEVTDLGHTYMRDTPFARRAIRDVTLTVDEGLAHGLIGPTGSGKSTLLQHLNGLLRPQEGAVRISSFDLTDPACDVRAVRRMAGLVFQMPEMQIFEQYVGDEIAYGPRLAGLEGETLRERVRWAMTLVGLDFEGFKDRLTFALSGGEKRKVALASTLALQPNILLLDEPTAGLDPGARHELLAHLQQLRAPEEGITIVLSSHQMEDIAALCRDVTVMSQGTTVASDGVSAIFGDADRLEAWGLAAPAAAEIATELNARGWSLSQDIIDEHQLVAALTERLAE